MLAVEEKLNELLDTDGGISKRKVSSFNDIQVDSLNLVVLSFCALCSYFTIGSIILLPEFLFNITSDEVFVYSFLL